MSKVKADMSGVAAKIAKIAKDQGLKRVLASQAAMGMDKFIPKRTGALALSVSIDMSGSKITYNAPYAVYVYNGEGMRFNTNGNPLARARWNEAYMESGGREQLAETGTNYLKGH